MAYAGAQFYCRYYCYSGYYASTPYCAHQYHSQDELELSSKYQTSMPRQDQCLLQMAKGLQYLHSKNVAHGDVKLRNILIKIGASVLKLADFVICKREDSFLMSNRIKGALYWRAS